MTDRELINRIEEEAKSAEDAHFTKLELLFMRDAIWARRRTHPVRCFVKYGQQIYKNGEFCLCGNCLKNGTRIFVSYEGDRSNYCKECGAEVEWDE